MKVRNWRRITEEEKEVLRLAQAAREIEDWEETARGHVEERAGDAEFRRRVLMRKLTMVGSVIAFIAAMGLIGWVFWVIQQPPP